MLLIGEELAKENAILVITECDNRLRFCHVPQSKKSMKLPRSGMVVCQYDIFAAGGNVAGSNVNDPPLFGASRAFLFFVALSDCLRICQRRCKTDRGHGKYPRAKRSHRQL